MTDKVDLTFLVHNRPKITKQCFDSLFNCTPHELYDLHILDDCSDTETRDILYTLGYDKFLNHNLFSLGTGKARNKIIEYTKLELKSKNDYLYLSDNDVFFKPKWLEVLLETYKYARSELNIIALGAYNHPYNQVYKIYPFWSAEAGKLIHIGLVHALSTQSWLWTYEDYDKYGPFPKTPVGKVRASEDVEVSNRIRASGKFVAVVLPHMIINTGRIDSFGDKIPGYELIEDQEGVVME